MTRTKRNNQTNRSNLTQNEESKLLQTAEISLKRIKPTNLTTPNEWNQSELKQNECKPKDQVPVKGRNATRRRVTDRNEEERVRTKKWNEPKDKAQNEEEKKVHEAMKMKEKEVGGRNCKRKKEDAKAQGMKEEKPMKKRRRKSKGNAEKVNGGKEIEKCVKKVNKMAELSLRAKAQKASQEIEIQKLVRHLVSCMPHVNKP